MADIHIMPASLATPALFRSCKALVQRMESGDDLGDRRHHIRMLSVSLEAAHRSLRRQIETLRALPPVPKVDTEGLCRSVEAWAGALATCAARIEAGTLRIEAGTLRS